MGRSRKVRPPILDQYSIDSLTQYVSVETLCAKYDITYKKCKDLAKAANAFRQIRKTTLVDRTVFEQAYKDVLVERREGESIKSIIHDDTIEPVRKHYMRYEEAAEFYSMSFTSFKKFVKETGAIRRLGNIVLINIDVVDKYIDEHF